MSERWPRTVVVLGLVSLCMDTSSELIHSLLPPRCCWRGWSTGWAKASAVRPAMH